MGETRLMLVHTCFGLHSYYVAASRRSDRVPPPSQHMPRARTVRSRQRLVVPACDNTVQTYLTDRLTLTRAPTTKCYPTYTSIMDTTAVVKLAATEQENEYSQDAQRFSDIDSTSSFEADLECTVVDIQETEEQEEVITEEPKGQSNTSTPPPKNASAAKRKANLYIPTPPLKKPKSTAIPVTIVSMLMMIVTGAMYSKYTKTVATGKMDKGTLQHLFTLLGVIGQLAQTCPGNSFVQRYLGQDLAAGLCTISLSAVQKKRLIGWLREFTTPVEDHTSTKNTERVDSHLAASMLPSPTIMPSTTYTSSTTADGRSALAGAPPSVTYPDRPSFVEPPALPSIYRPKTSGAFRSMSWTDQKFRYSVRSPGLEGYYALKLEIYDWKKIVGVPAQDWWKHTECRCFVPVMNRSPAMRAAIQLQESLKQLLETQEDAEGDYVQLKSSN